MVLILLALSILPVVVFGSIIYKNDFDKEPTSILVKLFICGIGSIFLTLLLTAILQSVIPFFGYDSNSLNVIELIPYIFIGVALIEEFSKWIFVYKLEYNDNEFNHLYDGIVYATFVSLGFACLENILYVMQFGIQTAIARSILAIPGHLCDGIMMGYYLSMAKLSLCNGNNKTLAKKNILLSLFIPTLAHGVYDYLLFAGEATGNDIFIMVFFGYVIWFFTFAYNKAKQLAHNTYNLNPNYVSVTHLKKMNKAYNQPIYGTNMYNQPQVNYTNQQMYYPNNQQVTANRFCTNCGSKVDGRFCSICGKEVK